MKYLIILCIALVIAAKGAQRLALSLADNIGSQCAKSVQVGLEAGLDSYNVEDMAKTATASAGAKVNEVKTLADAKVKEVQETDLILGK